MATSQSIKKTLNKLVTPASVVDSIDMTHASAFPSVVSDYFPDALGAVIVFNDTDIIINLDILDSEEWNEISLLSLIVPASADISPPIVNFAGQTETIQCLFLSHVRPNATMFPASTFFPNLITLQLIDTGEHETTNLIRDLPDTLEEIFIIDSRLRKMPDLSNTKVSFARFANNYITEISPQLLPDVSRFPHIILDFSRNNIPQANFNLDLLANLGTHVHLLAVNCGIKQLPAGIHGTSQVNNSKWEVFIHCDFNIIARAEILAVVETYKKSYPSDPPPAIHLQESERSLEFMRQYRSNTTLFNKNYKTILAKI